MGAARGGRCPGRRGSPSRPAANGVRRGVGRVPGDLSPQTSVPLRGAVSLFLVAAAVLALLLLFVRREDAQGVSALCRGQVGRACPVAARSLNGLCPFVRWRMDGPDGRGADRSGQQGRRQTAGETGRPSPVEFIWESRGIGPQENHSSDPAGRARIPFFQITPRARREPALPLFIMRIRRWPLIVLDRSWGTEAS